VSFITERQYFKFFHVLDIKTIICFRYSTVYAVCVLSSQNYRQKFQVCISKDPFSLSYRAIIIIILSLVKGLFFLVLLLNLLWSPRLRLQVPGCSTFHIMCDVPYKAVFYSDSIECFPGMASKCFHKPFVTILVAPIVTVILLCFRFHVHCILIRKLLYLSFVSASFCTKFLSAGIASPINMHVFLYVFNYYIWPICCNFSVCTAWCHNTVTSSCSYMGLGMCVYHLFVISMPRALHIE